MKTVHKGLSYGRDRGYTTLFSVLKNFRYADFVARTDFQKKSFIKI